MTLLKKILTFLAMALTLAMTLTALAPVQTADAQVRPVTPVAKHGQLSVVGPHIRDRHGAVTSLAGPSFFWSNTGWGQERFYTKGAVETFARDWNADVVRIALGAQNDGSFLQDPQGNAKRMETVIDAAIANGLYVIVDWHSHQAEQNTAQAIQFFSVLAKKYGHTPNLIYEIYNEPLDTTDWTHTIKPYAQKVISAIRRIDPDNLIIVGTPRWSQDVDVAADNPIRGHSNILYSLHFYAATHKGALRQKAEYAIRKGLPLIISEWGSVTYSGDGGLDVRSTHEWMAFAKYHGLSHLNWSVSDKNESASMFRSGANPNGGWSSRDLTPSGRLARDIIRSW